MLLHICSTRLVGLRLYNEENIILYIIFRELVSRLIQLKT